MKNNNQPVMDGCETLLSENRASTLEFPKKKYDSSCECAKPTIFFHDGRRSVDFVLVWDSFTDQAITNHAIEKRKLFEKNLIKEGLELEYEMGESNGLNFIKVLFILRVEHKLFKFNSLDSS